MEPTAEPREDGRRGSGLRSAPLFVLFVILLLATLMMGPLAYGQSLSQGRVFTWSPASNTYDYSYHLSFMRQGADGLWRVQNLSVIDRQNSDINHLIYVAAGHASSLLHVDIPIMNQIARVVTGALFVLVAWWFISRRLDPQTQVIALLMLCFSSGLGWTEMGRSANSADLWLNEMTTFTALYFSPHIAWALALKALAIFCLFVGVEKREARYAVVAGICWAFLAFDHPFDLYGIVVVYAAYMVVGMAGDRLAGRPFDLGLWVRHFAVTAAVAAPFVGLMYFQYLHNPLLVYRSSINVEALPRPLELLSGLGLVGVLALVPLIWCAPSLRLRFGQDLEAITSGKVLAFLYTWAFSTLAAMYALGGTWFGRRLILGAHLPLAILAAIGVMLIARALLGQPIAWRRWALGIAAVLAACITNIHLLQIEMIGYETGFGRAIQGTCRLYLEQREIDRLRAIGSAAPADAFVQPLPVLENGVPDLTLMYFGPWLTGRHQICGHPFETPNYTSRLQSLVKHAERDQGVVVGSPRGTQVLPL